MSTMLQLILGIGFVVLACFLTYKITVPICVKIIDLCFVSPIFRRGTSIFLAVIFGAVGILLLEDFTQEIKQDLSCFFPLSFLLSGIFLFLTFWKRGK